MASLEKARETADTSEKAALYAFGVGTSRWQYETRWLSYGGIDPSLVTEGTLYVMLDTSYAIETISNLDYIYRWSYPEGIMANHQPYSPTIPQPPSLSVIPPRPEVTACLICYGDMNWSDDSSDNESSESDDYSLPDDGDNESSESDRYSFSDDGDNESRELYVPDSSDIDFSESDRGYWPYSDDIETQGLDHVIVKKSSAIA